MIESNRPALDDLPVLRVVHHKDGRTIATLGGVELPLGEDLISMWQDNLGMHRIGLYHVLLHLVCRVEVVQSFEEASDG